jgi:hypothetical protein
MSARLQAQQAVFCLRTGLSSSVGLSCACRADLTGFAAGLLVYAKWVLRPQIFCAADFFELTTFLVAW